MLRREKGFTLVELLVVIAIILVLAAILFPVFARIKEKANQTKCAANLKQLGSACEMYQDDNDQMLPPAGNPFFYGYHWPDILAPYLKQIKGDEKAFTGAGILGEVFRCPSAPEEAATAEWMVERSYGMNRYCGLGDWKNGDPSTKVWVGLVPLAKVKYPAQTVRITESWDVGGQGGSAYAPMPHQSDWVRAPGWHNNRNCVLWVDGHVNTMKVPTEGRTSREYSCLMYRDNIRDELRLRGNYWCRLTPKDPPQ